jgi:hypothetical protein
VNKYCGKTNVVHMALYNFKECVLKQALTYGIVYDGLEDGVGFCSAGGYSASLTQHFDLCKRVDARSGDAVVCA